ncbi:hypothetical protein DFP72DRAFT_1049966, partial [Ephemerocybe angulata]
MSSSLPTNIVLGESNEQGNEVAESSGDITRIGANLPVQPTFSLSSPSASFASTCNQREGVEFRSEPVRPLSERGARRIRRLSVSNHNPLYPLQVQLCQASDPGHASAPASVIERSFSSTPPPPYSTFNALPCISRLSLQQLFYASGASLSLATLQHPRVLQTAFEEKTLGKDRPPVPQARLRPQQRVWEPCLRSPDMIKESIVPHRLSTTFNTVALLGLSTTPKTRSRVLLSGSQFAQRLTGIPPATLKRSFLATPAPEDSSSTALPQELINGNDSFSAFSVLDDPIIPIINNAQEDAPAPLPPLHQPSTMTRIGNQRSRTGEGGVTRGSDRKTGETHSETHTECTRGAKALREAENSCSDYSGASEEPESRVEGWNPGGLSQRGERREHMATSSFERIWMLWSNGPRIPMRVLRSSRRIGRANNPPDPSGSAAALVNIVSRCFQAFRLRGGQEILMKTDILYYGIGLARIGGGRSLLCESTLCTRLVFQYICETIRVSPSFFTRIGIELMAFSSLA